MATSEGNDIDKEHMNWLTATLALNIPRDILGDEIEKIIEKFHKMLIHGNPRMCGKCDTGNVKFEENTKTWILDPNCPKCQPWVTRVSAEHASKTGHDVYKKNSDMKKWPSHSWEIAKFYMPRGQEATNTGPDKTDCAALFSMMSTCKLLKQKFKSKKIEKFKKAGNALIQTLEFVLSTAGQKLREELGPKIEEALKVRAKMEAINQRVDANEERITSMENQVKELNKLKEKFESLKDAGPTPSSKVQAKKHCNVTGYLLKVSPIKLSKKYREYFTAQLQTDRETTQHVVCYAPEKHQELQAAMRSDLPVRLMRVRLTTSESGSSNDIEMTRISHLEYIKDQQLGYDKLPPLLPVTIKQAKAKLPQETVSIQASVLQVRGVKKQELFEVLKRKQEVIVADASGAISLIIWEKLVETVEAGKSYTFSDVATRDFDGMHLTTTPDTEISSIEPLGSVSQDTVDVPTPTATTAHVAAVSVKIVKRCFSCSKKVEASYDFRTVRCLACNKKQAVKVLETNTSATFTLKTDDETKSEAEADEETLREFLQEERLLTQEDALEDHFLAAGQLIFHLINARITKIEHCAPATRNGATSSSMEWAE